MDFLDPKKRRKNELQLLFGYVLVAIAVLMATVVLIYYANGFGMSRDGSLVQRGLVFVASQPTGSDLYVDGKKKTKTNTKLHLTAGVHDLAIKRTGYYNWSRKIMVEGSGVDHYVYPQLIPKKRESTAVATLETAPILTTQSLDKRWLITQQVAGDVFDQYDLKKTTAEVGTPVALTVPSAMVTPSSGAVAWSVVEWSTNNRHILLVRTYETTEGQKHEYILFDRQRPEGTHNLTNELSLDAEMSVTLRDKNPETYFVLNKATKTVSTASLSNTKLETYQEHVLAFKTHGVNTMLYATDDDAEDDEARIILRDDKNSYVLRSVARSETYLLDLAHYDGDWFVAAGSAAANRVFLYKNPTTSIAANTGGQPKILFGFNVKNPINLAFSSNAQFISVQNGQVFQVYDAEFNRAYNWAPVSPIEGPTKYAEWIDGHRFSYVSGGKQIVIEYDGINAHALAASSKAIGGFYDRDNRVLYTYNTLADNTKTQLLVTQLRTASDQ